MNVSNLKAGVRTRETGGGAKGAHLPPEVRGLPPEHTDLALGREPVAGPALARRSAPRGVRFRRPLDLRAPCRDAPSHHHPGVGRLVRVRRDSSRPRALVLHAGRAQDRASHAVSGGLVLVARPFSDLGVDSEDALQVLPPG